MLMKNTMNTKDIRNYLKTKHQLVPFESQMLIVPKFQELSLSLKQYYTFHLTRLLYNFLFKDSSQDTTMVLHRQQEVEGQILGVVDQVNRILSINTRQSVFTVLVDYSEIWSLFNTLSSQASEARQAAIATTLLCMMSISEIISFREKISVPLTELLDLIPEIIGSDRETRNDMSTLATEMFITTPYSRKAQTTIESTERLGSYLLSDKALNLFKSALISYGARRGALSRTNQRSMIFLSPLETTTAVRSVLNIVIQSMCLLHIETIQKQIEFVKEDMGILGSYVNYLHSFFENLVTIKGVIDTSIIRGLLNNAKAKVITGVEPVEVVLLVKKILALLSGYANVEPAQYVASVEAILVDSLREQWHLENQINVISNTTLLNVDSIEKSDPIPGFTPIEPQWFEKHIISWQDILTLVNRVKLTTTRVSTNNNSDTITTKMYATTIPIIPINTNNKDHDPIPLQLDALSPNQNTKRFHVIPLTIPPSKRTLNTVKVLVNSLVNDIQANTEARRAFYSQPIEADITEEMIQSDLKYISQSTQLTQSVITINPIIDASIDLRIFDMETSKIVLPIVVSKANSNVIYSQFEMIHETEFYRVYLVPEDQVASVKGVSYYEYMNIRQDDATIPDITLTYPIENDRYEVIWPLTYDFSMPARIECDILNDIVQPSRAVTDVKIKVNRVSINEVLLRLQLRRLLHHVLKLEKDGDKSIRWQNVFKMAYNVFYDGTTGYSSFDAIIKSFGRYDTHETFSIKHKKKDLKLLSTIVHYVLCTLAYTEQSAIAHLAIPAIIDINNMGSVELKKYASKWFSGLHANIDRGMIQSLNDTGLSIMEKTFNSYNVR